MSERSPQGISLLGFFFFNLRVTDYASLTSSTLSRRLKVIDMPLTIEWYA